MPREVPAQAEIVIEGHILPNVREPEGLFAEFTGYVWERSTQQVIEVTAITHRRDAIYHDITLGISDEHTLMLAVPQEVGLTVWWQMIFVICEISALCGNAVRHMLGIMPYAPNEAGPSTRLPRQS